MSNLLHSGEYAACHWVRTGQEFSRRLLRALASAKHSIRLEVYIFANDSIGRAVRSALTLAVLHGVEVRVLLDALGSKETADGFWDEFLKAGGSLRWFNPLDLRRLPLRNHRKLIVVDDRSAGTGGFNIAEEYAGDGVEQGWADVGVALVGPAVASLAAEFDRMWAVAAANPKLTQLLRGAGRHGIRQVAPDIQLLATGPGRTAGAFQYALLGDLAVAQNILLVVAYFVPTRPVRQALREAAARGARVRILVPGRSDVELSRRAARHLYGRLMRTGVEILEYQPQVLHAKLYLTDTAAYAGSSNLDIRSLYINHELMLRFTESEIVRRGWDLGEEFCQRAHKIDPQTWPRARSWFERLREQWSYWLLSKADPWATRWLARDPR